jgi:hypothetical protein
MKSCLKFYDPGRGNPYVRRKSTGYRLKDHEQELANKLIGKLVSWRAIVTYVFTPRSMLEKIVENPDPLVNGPRTLERIPPNRREEMWDYLQYLSRNGTKVTAARNGETAESNLNLATTVLRARNRAEAATSAVA